MEYFTSKQRCWCVHWISLKVSAFQQQYSDSEDSFTLGLQLCNQTTGVSGAGRPSPISLFSHNCGSCSQRPNVSSSSVAALTVPPWQQPQTRFTDGPLKRQCSWSRGCKAVCCFQTLSELQTCAAMLSSLIPSFVKWLREVEPKPLWMAYESVLEGGPAIAER